MMEENWENLGILSDMRNSVDYMCSENWKQRFIAEYAQLITRMERITDILWKEDELDNMNCPISLLSLQLERMEDYKQILLIRAELYGIDLDKEVEKLNY